MDTRAAHALIRFGLGRRADEPAPADPHGWLVAQLEAPDPTPVAGRPGTPDAMAAQNAERALREQEKAARAAGLPAPAVTPGDNPVRALIRDDRHDMIANALTTPAPFRERLVWFWMNHFAVSLKQGDCAVFAGAFVREAIRPYVTARFADMVLAVMQHPAMLLYLDNAQSVGPDSIAGQRQHRGLNENLARECLELHTLGVDGGYTQADVTSLAAIITGWSIERREPPFGFRFRPNAHEPGEKVLLGRRFDEGQQGGIDALTFLGEHPASYRHIATKLVRHFVADAPAPGDVRRVETVLRETRGDLMAAYRALIALPAAWVPLTKLRTPLDYTVAALRALDLPPDRQPDAVGALGGLGQPLWAPPFPAGWPDQASEWAGPEALLRRIDWAYGLAGRADAQVEPEAVAEASLGPLLGEATVSQIRGAGSRRDALTLLFGSPEFQRR